MSGPDVCYSSRRLIGPSYFCPCISAGTEVQPPKIVQWRNFRDTSVTKRDWLIFLLAYKGENGSALDPVCIQKGMFLLSQEGVIPESERYEFEPYHYGPYSFELREDADNLVRQNLADKLAVSGYTWGRYRLTGDGIDYATQIIDGVGPEAARKVFAVKSSPSGSTRGSGMH
ncbi:MAG: hypothetical protein JJE35_03955 [Thermoleophilia bacterium]|nr:hypothetical protein [Thermoleophilia bacterium]